MPMLRLLIPLIMGILAYQPNNYYPIRILVLFILLLFFFINTPLRTRLIKKGITVFSIVFITGFALCFLNDIRNNQKWFGHFKSDQLIIKINTMPVSGNYYKTALTTVQMIKLQDQWKQSIGHIKLQLPLQVTLTPNTILLLKKTPMLIPDTGSRRSYARYLANQNIYHQIKLKTKDFIILEQPVYKTPFIQTIQQKTLAIIDQYFPNLMIRGLAKALLVGYRGELDKELNTAYINTGVVHVIAISGLHLGLIYGLLMLLFKPLQHKKSLRIFSCCGTISVLWIFTLMCGASPSVVRSAIMFSFLILGKIIQSKAPTGNILAASAFVMLCYDPFLLYDIGFQLSYAAVGSLLIYNKPISQIFQPENGWLQLGWSSISTSLSAQILTTPFVLFHFHQFPLIFILSNIVAIPLSSIALLLLILVCVFSTWPFIASILASWANGCLWLMNDRIIALAALPFSKLEGLPFNGLDLSLSLVCIGLLTIYLKQKALLALKAFLSTVLLWSILYHFSS